MKQQLLTNQLLRWLHESTCALHCLCEHAIAGNIPFSTAEEDEAVL